METENEKRKQCSSRGILPKLFCENVEEEFLCTSCNLVLWMAMQASCGCRFCSSCIQSGDAECPSCKIKINSNEITDDFYARRRLRKKRMCCINKPNGCEDILDFKDLEDHLKQCNYVKVNCIYFKSGCDTNILRIQLKHHLEKECVFRLVDCKYCNEKISLNKMKNHNCVYKPNVCSNECGSKPMLSEELNEHLKNTCPLEEISCQFEKLGCNIKFFRKDLRAHQQEYMDKHLVMMSEKSEEQNMINSKLGRENAELVSECQLLTSKFETMSTNYASSKNKLQDVDSEFQKFMDMTKMMFRELQKKNTATSQQFGEQIALLHQEQKEQSQCIQDLETKTRKGREHANLLPPARLAYLISCKKSAISM